MAPGLAIFESLENLDLHWSWADLDEWQRQLILILRNSPGLRKLGLSISVDVFRTCYRAGRDHEYEHLFNRLCDAYGETGAAPLRPKSLRLGQALYPTSASSFAKMIDLDSLEEVQLENYTVGLEDGDMFGIIDPSPDNSEIDRIIYGVFFSSSSCPNLRRFTARRYSGDIHDVLAWMDKTCVQRLALSFSETSEPDLAYALRAEESWWGWPSFPLHPRMLELEMHRNKIDISGSYEPITDEQVFYHLASYDPQNLESLMVNLAPDRDAEGGVVGLRELCQILNGFSKLTQMVVKSDAWRGVGIGVGDDDTEIKAVAKILALAIPYLRYIRIQGLSWRIWRQADGLITLEDLDSREIRQVEWLFQSMYEAGWSHDSEPTFPGAS